MSSFNDLKRNSANSAQKLQSELQKLNSPNQPGKDERLWSCQTDKAGNGYAVIRFLPAPANEDVPFVRLFTHGFKGPAGGWYIENSRTTIGENDPVAEMNSELWNQGEGSPGRKRVTGSGKENPGTKRQLNYYSNIYVIKDPANPENEGKVFLFRYGKKLFDKIQDLANPQFEGEEPIDAFNLWTGANFKLKIRRVEGYANFDSSSFDPAGPLLDDDDALEAIWKSEHSLQAIVAKDQFKTYEELSTKLARVLGTAPTQQQQAARQRVADEPAPAAPVARSAPEPKIPAAGAEDDDDDFAFFKNLATEDDDVPF